MSRRCDVDVLNVCGVIMCCGCRDIQTLSRIWKIIFKGLTLEGPYIIFAMYIQSNEIHNVVALIKY